MSNEVTVQGIKGLERAFARVLKAVDFAAKQGVSDTAEATLKLARREVPVDTGNLRDSHRIQQDVRGFQAAVGSDDKKAGYNIFVEFGHRTQSGSFVAANPWMQRTFFKMIRPTFPIFIRAIKKALSADF